ncbi:exodeoxyribonuclease VII large subunit [Brevibacillus sp. SYSU BS000544]|uniref:exodeoxyribonuclease VII large subunit n=1 Tax=Brevibacillus sp. SYSU BS000544 TaxID=3416443 RepID=UPI003CE4C46D
MRTTEIWSVSQLNRYLKGVIERDSLLQDIWLRGEISNFTKHSSGHMYFTLKDKDSRIKVVMFASHNRFLTFIPKDGTRALVRGSISVFERDGAYQMYARELQPDGIGSLYLAYEQLKEKLNQEGLFAQERKRSIPAYPRKVGVVTSPTGAAIRDIVITIKRRFPQVQIVIAPAIVQGVDAPRSIVSAINKMNQYMDIDVLIVGRGGGSIEELWAFNDELVARTISGSRIPVISAVGHETDVTIADFVADIRAATPTAAAELAVPHYLDVLQQLKQLEHRVHRSMQVRISQERKKLERYVSSYGMRQPERRIDEMRQRTDQLSERLNKAFQQTRKLQSERMKQLQARLYRFRFDRITGQHRITLTQQNERMGRAIRRRLDQDRLRWVHLIEQLDALSPLKIMQRGYALVYKNDQLVKTTKSFAVGDELMLRLVDGNVRSVVTEIEQEEKQDGSQKS